MDSPIAHHVNNSNSTGGGTGTGTVLSAGLSAAFQNLPGQEVLGGGSSSPGFGAPWSVQTSCSPPPLGQPPDPDGFYPGVPSSVPAAFFQGFSPVSPHPGPGITVQGFGSRRSPVSPPRGAFLQQRNNNNQQQPMVKQSPWGSHQGNGWVSGGVSWGRDPPRRGPPGSPLKRPFSSSIIAPPRAPRPPGPRAWEDGSSNALQGGPGPQERSRMYESLNMHSLESSLIDIMRAEQDPLKGRVGGANLGAHGLLMLNGRSSLFPIDDNLLDAGRGHQGAPGGHGPCYPHHNGERFSRKVFVGGLPPDIDEDEITSSFRRFGHLVVDWPHKAESKSYFPPKGYAFLLFQEESSVQALIEACMEEDGKLYLCVSSPTIKDKPVQIRPWNLSDSDFVMDGSQPLDPRKTIFVGGVPRPLRAIELAMIMDRLYGGVCYAGIDTDPELKYPKGAGRVAFSNQQSYIAAISARFVQLQHGDIDKRVEVKPYVLDDQLCDECQGARCGGKFAPFFCANVTCLQYYCEFCWANIHSRAGREFHKPLVKEGADRPRQIHFRWN
ncbi:cytoplasmic polyadenylation element-binding protein 2 isoform X2 [Pseudoliparis swirei]|uniref:cytoplasmic polyadenylation element-binding protein 2 isoform X2 n=1 Tax=Pseudoliparis swirei TaxID=2059687 RepID=UPI0024BE3FE8|nr:cytoplasmic polyadenylation element-binding protein 2 isoform X2 [Pseudoliparis swirei]